MGFFSRLANVFKGFLGLFVSGLENQNPAAVYESAIHARTEQYQKLMKAVSGIVYLRNKLQKEHEEKSALLAQIQQQVLVAVESGEEDTALVLIEKKNTLTHDLEHIMVELEKTKNEAEEAKASLVSFQGEIEKLRGEKERMMAQRENAKARIQIQEQLSGLSTDADIKALSNVRDSIEKLKAQADVSDEINGSTLGSKLKDIQKKASTVAAKSEFEEIKKQLAAKKNQNTEKTL